MNNKTLCPDCGQPANWGLLEGTVCCANEACPEYGNPIPQIISLNASPPFEATPQ